MKHILITILLFSALYANAQFSSGNLQAAGLTCAMCTKAINTSLEKLSFIESVKADIKSSSFNITFRKEAGIDIDALRRAVEDAGFSVAKLKLTGSFNDVKIQPDTHVQINGNTFHFLNTTNQTLEGERTLVLADKNFVSDKEFRKISSSSKLNCVQSGKAGSCCTREGIPENTRVYHVTI
jgi:copper chaperone CopZ